MSDMVERVGAAIKLQADYWLPGETHDDYHRRVAAAAMGACAAEIDALVERRKADKRNQGNDHISATAAFLRHAALKGEAE